MTVTVYSTPGCQQCTATKRALESQGIPYDPVDLSKNDEALQFLKELGYQQAPVVVVSEDDHWYGFRPDRIAELVAA